MGANPVNISASRGSAILGLSKYKSPFVAWLELMEFRIPGFCKVHGYKIPEKKDPWAEPLDPKLAPLRWGLAFENSICSLVGNITNREKAYQHPEHNFITCHIDGLKNVDGTINLQENKTAFDMAFKMGWGEPETDMIPLNYQVQVQHQMACTGIENTDVNVLVFPTAPADWEKQGFRINKYSDSIWKNGAGYITLFAWAEMLKELGYFHKYHVTSSKSAQKEIIDRYLAFWNDCVLRDNEPPVNGYDDIKWLIPSPEGEIEADERITELWSELVDIENEADAGKLRVKTIKNEIAKYIQTTVPKDSAKKGRISVYAGSRKLASWNGKQFRINRPKKD